MRSLSYQTWATLGKWSPVLDPSFLANLLFVPESWLMNPWLIIIFIQYSLNTQLIAL